MASFVAITNNPSPVERLTRPYTLTGSYLSYGCREIAYHSIPSLFSIEKTSCTPIRKDLKQEDISDIIASTFNLRLEGLPGIRILL
jgi:hypothetical protein